jgi:hypothetical protein
LACERLIYSFQIRRIFSGGAVAHRRLENKSRADNSASWRRFGA